MHLASEELLRYEDNRLIVNHFSASPNDINLRSVCLFLDTFIEAPTEISAFSYMDFLPRMFANSAENSCLHKAVLAASLRNFLNRHHATDMTYVANKAFAEALKCTNRALADSTTKLTDETLVAVHLLSIHELLCPFSIRGTWRVHVQGTLPLLLMRGSEQFESDQGRQIFRAVHSPILVRALRFGEELPESFQYLAPTMPFPVSIALQITLYLQKVVVLRSRLLKVLSTENKSALSTRAGSDRQRRIVCLVNEGQRIDESSDIDGWTANDPLWKTHSIHSRTIRQKHRGYCSVTALTQFYWRSLYVMGNWVRFWAARMYLFETLAKSTTELYDTSTDVDFQRNMLNNISTFQSKVECMADSILSAFRFALGELDSDGQTEEAVRFSDSITASGVGPLLYFYALKAIEDFEFTTAVQKSLARESLIRIGVERGIGSALITRWNE